MSMKYRLTFLVIVLLGVFATHSVEAAKRGPLPILSETFNNYSLGALEGQSGWASYDGVANFSIESVSRKDKIVHATAYGDNIITKTGKSLTDGLQTVYVKTENRVSWGPVLDGNVQVRISDAPWSIGANRFIAVTLKADGNVAYFDPVNYRYENFATYSDNTWTKIEIEWRSSDKTARYSVNDGVSTNWLPFIGNDTFTSFNNVGLEFYLPSGSGGVYFDNLK